MATHDVGRRPFRIRPVHLVAALLAIMVFTAGGTAVLRDAPEIAGGPLLPLDAPVPGSAVATSGGEAVGMSLGDGDAGRLRGALEGDLGSDAVFADDEAPESKALAATAATEPEARPGDDALIVRTADLELEVEDVAAVLLLARAELSDVGGYVAGSDEYDQGERRWASVIYRVPVARFTEAIDALRGLSDRVVRESTQSQEVTATVVDLDARIANLRASEGALVSIMDRTGRIEDVLAVQLRLEDVRGQIERLEAQRKNLADRAALATLAVTWYTPVAAVTVAQEGWELGTEVDAALAQTVEALQGVASLGVYAAVVVLPLLGIPVLLLIVVVALLRRRRRHTDEDGPGGPTALGAAAE